MQQVEVTLVLPKILGQAIGTGRIKVKAKTLSEALDLACEKEPALSFHIFESPGKFRGHVLCFHNGENTRDMKSLNVPLSNGDEITIFQAISGG